MARIIESKAISGLYVAHLKSFGDGRGRFMETFRKEWFPQRSWDRLQCNRSDSQANVLRGLHFHRHQVDYWYCANGSIRVGLVDLRSNSPTYLATQTIEMGTESEIGLFIPCGVAHGFVTLTNATLTYIVDNYYNGGADENGVAWNDPEIALDWGVASPVVSDRDAQNPWLKDILAESFPL